MKTQLQYFVVAGSLVLGAAALIVLVTERRQVEVRYVPQTREVNQVASTSPPAERRPLAERPEADEGPKEATLPAVARKEEQGKEPNTLQSETAAAPPAPRKVESKQRHPTTQTARTGRIRSKYADMKSLDELAAILRELRSLDRYSARALHMPGADPGADLLDSARRLASIRDENWPRANWHLAQLLVDLGKIPESAQVLNALLNESEFPVDEAMRVDVMFRLALMEFDRPRAYWAEDRDSVYIPGRLLSLSSPGQPAFDVAERLLGEILDTSNLDDRSRALVEDFITAVGKWRTYAREHPRQILTHTPDVLHDPMLDFRTTVVLMQELYATSAHSQDRSRVLRYVEERMPEIVGDLAQLPLEERRAWSTDAAWILHERRDPVRVKEVIEPLLADSQVWEDTDSYLRAQYYLASAYSKLGEQVPLKAVAQRLAREGFDPKEMEPNQREFFQGLQKGPSVAGRGQIFE